MPGKKAEADGAPMDKRITWMEQRILPTHTLAFYLFGTGTLSPSISFSFFFGSLELYIKFCNFPLIKIDINVDSVNRKYFNAQPLL